MEKEEGKKDYKKHTGPSVFPACNSVGILY